MARSRMILRSLLSVAAVLLACCIAATQSSDFDQNRETVYTEKASMSVDGQNSTLTVKTAAGQPLNPSGKNAGQWTRSGKSLDLTIDGGGK